MGYNQHFSRNLVEIFTGLRSNSSSRNFAHRLLQPTKLLTSAIKEIKDLIQKVDSTETKDIERLREVQGGLIYMSYLQDLYWISYCNRALSDQHKLLDRLLKFFVVNANGIDDDGVTCNENLRQTLKAFKMILDNDPDEDLATKFGILIIYFIRELFEANDIKTAAEAVQLIDVLENGALFEDINCIWLRIKKLQFVKK